MIITFGHQRYWQKPDGTQIPIKDAPYSVPAIPSEQDIKNATKGDPFNCMYAQYFKRMYESSIVSIEREVALVEMPDQDGKLWLYRYILTDPAKAKLKDFDAGKELPKHAVVFARPSPSRTLHGQAEARSRWEIKKLREERKKKARGKKTIQKAPNKPKRKAHIVGSVSEEEKAEDQVTLLRKPGQGMFQFHQKQA